MLNITATNSNGTAVLDIEVGDPQSIFVPNIGNGAQLFLYQLTLADSPIEMFDTNTGNLIARLTQADILIGGNPGDLSSPARIFSFALTMNAVDDDTTFTFAGNEYFLDTPYGGASGFASTAYTLTDGNGDGASLTGQGYNALYNGGNDFFTGGPLADLSTGAFGSTSSAYNDPGDLSNRFIGPVSSITADGGFTLSANDAASINTQFFVVPTPASAALLGLGGLVATRRRR
ncbi:MAG: hypothetical protein ACF8Q5_01145 [Phycisphaerales bacterium JB040]